MNWELILKSLSDKSDLTNDQVTWAMSQILEGKASNDEIRQFLTGLKSKGESAAEVEALVAQMYSYCAPINISTAAAIVTNAAGARVVKHGNRAASSKSGSADLLEALGIKIDLTGAEVEQTVHKIGIGFCFAPIFHSSMKHAAVARKELGVPTVFNILGPLANPAKPTACAIGVARAELLPLMAQVLLEQGKEGFVFRGDDGLDEVSLSTTTQVIQISDGKLNNLVFNPSDLGITSSPISALAGGDAAYNAQMTMKIFAGEKGAMRDAVTLNAAFAIAAFKADFNLPLQTQIANGFVLANKAIDSGAALSVVKKWAELTKEIVSAR